MKTKYVFNHYYILRHDKYRSVLCSPMRTNPKIKVNSGWYSCIHPIYVMILSFFSSPVSMDDVIKKITDFFDFSLEYAEDLVVKFIENKDTFHTIYAGCYNNFPMNLIIREDALNEKIRIYKPEFFAYNKIDLSSFRLFSAPLYLTFMVNNKCLTDCIYCYADRYTKCENMAFPLVEKIIDEAYKLGLTSFNVDGGEFFMYPEWRKLLTKLQSRGYKPEVVSTKYPISLNVIEDFSKFDVNLQVSLDSLNPIVLDSIVGHIPNYAKRMEETLINIDKVMHFQIATILTAKNKNVEELETIYKFLKKMKNLTQWEIRVGFKSLYSKHDFESIQIKKADIEIVHQWVLSKQKNSEFKIRWTPGQETNFFKAEKGSEDFVGGRCSANTLHMFVLPDGNVTICEQLYWKRNFLIGDLKKNTISEVWNSDRALFLANISQSEHSKDSVCRTCKIFSKCKLHSNKCYANILKVYGDAHWDYPDPRCNKAPRNISQNIYV